MVTHTRNSCSAFNPSKCTHTVVNTHTHIPWTGFGALLKGLTLVVVLRVEESTGHSLPHFTPCRTWDSNPRLLGYKFDSLTIRPRLPQFLVLEGRCPAKFSYNPNQTHLNQLIKVLLGILETSKQVCWGKLELNSAGHRPSRTKFSDHCARWWLKVSGFHSDL